MIEQGIELLTGIPAGVRGEDGQYPPGTVFRKVEDRFDAYYHALEQHREAGLVEQSHTTITAPNPQQPPGAPR